jgi:metal-dependent amidase/aminoacylase/carboxypeptidase family protein
MTGTIRSDGCKTSRIKQVTSIAESAGATADIDIIKQTLITYNDPILTEKCPNIRRSAGKDNVSITPAVMGAEDFSSRKNSGLYFFLGGAQRQANI